MRARPELRASCGRRVPFDCGPRDVYAEVVRLESGAPIATVVSDGRPRSFSHTRAAPAGAPPHRTTPHRRKLNSTQRRSGPDRAAESKGTLTVNESITAVSGVATQPTDETQSLPWWARRVGFAWITIITGLGSLIAASVLVGERIQIYLDENTKTSCDWGGAFSCSSVMKSEAAQAFGFPNPFIGLVGFTVLVVIGVTVLSGASMPRWYWIGFQVGVLAAFAFLVWLYSEALYVIGALCIYCMICWLMMTILMFVSLGRSILTGVLPAPAWAHAWARGWTWLTAIIVIIACAASILFRFMGLFFPA